MSNRKSKTNQFMTSVSESAKQVLDTLTEGLTTVEAAAKLDNAPGVFMALHVECIGQVAEGTLYSVAHYYEQNGDLMRDPDIERGELLSRASRRTDAQRSLPCGWAAA